MTEARDRLASLLRHEAKSNTYKFALIRALNDLALEHPLPEGDVAVPLRRVAERWLVYYWPFVDPARPLLQGAVAARATGQAQDMSFRPALTEVRRAWETLPHARSHPGDGALLLADYQVDRGRLPDTLVTLTRAALQAIAHAVRQPVRYAGPGGAYALFGAPGPAATLQGLPLPGTRPSEPAFVVPSPLWQTLRELSLWVEALTVQQWSLYTERVKQHPPVSRGEAFALVTAQPEARTPLTWERHAVRVMMLGGVVFTCPWTGTGLTPEKFALDHLIPVATHPINEVWNLVPSDPWHNSHVKRARIPSPDRLACALPHLQATYGHYAVGTVASALTRDVQGRFGTALPPVPLAAAVTRLADAVAQARNAPRY